MPNTVRLTTFNTARSSMMMVELDCSAAMRSTGASAGISMAASRAVGTEPQVAAIGNGQSDFLAQGGDHRMGHGVERQRIGEISHPAALPNPRKGKLSHQRRGLLVFPGDGERHHILLGAPPHLDVYGGEEQVRAIGAGRKRKRNNRYIDKYRKYQNWKWR